MPKGKVSAPMSSAGLMRFFDEDTGGPRLTPQGIFLLSAGFIALVIILNML